MTRRSASRIKAPSYPALALYQHLHEVHQDRRLPRATRIRLWRAACWEAAAQESLRVKDDRREREDQRRAIAALCVGWSVGDRGTEHRLEEVKLDDSWQRKYVDTLNAIRETAERAA